MKPGCQYQAAYEALAEEFTLSHTLIEARTRAGLTQPQLAGRMKTSQSYVARLEGGKVRPSSDALVRFARATGTRLSISLPTPWPTPPSRPFRRMILLVSRRG